MINTWKEKMDKSTETPLGLLTSLICFEHIPSDFRMHLIVRVKYQIYIYIYIYVDTHYNISVHRRVEEIIHI